MNVATSMYLSFDTILLSVLAPGNYQTGLYQLAAKLKSFILTAITAIVNVITPRMSYLTRDGESGEYTLLLKQSFSFLFTLSLAHWHIHDCLCESARWCLFPQNSLLMQFLLYVLPVL